VGAMKVVKFKSNSDFYYKEKFGLKNNTCRELNKEDVRFTALVSGEARFIIIELASSNGTEFFKRAIRDVSVWNDLIIITWFE
jgi:hypothetical protein